MRAFILAADGFEDGGLLCPHYRLQCPGDLRAFCRGPMQALGT
jgi:hypothetical protein